MSSTSAPNQAAGTDFEGSAQDLIDALDQVIHQTLDAAADAAGVDDFTGLPADSMDAAADEGLVTLLGNADDVALIDAGEWLATAGHF